MGGRAGAIARAPDRGWTIDQLSPAWLAGAGVPTRVRPGSELGLCVAVTTISGEVLLTGKAHAVSGQARNLQGSQERGSEAALVDPSGWLPLPGPG